MLTFRHCERARIHPDCNIKRIPRAIRSRPTRAPAMSCFEFSNNHTLRRLQRTATIVDVLLTAVGIPTVRWVEHCEVPAFTSVLGCRLGPDVEAINIARNVVSGPTVWRSTVEVFQKLSTVPDLGDGDRERPTARPLVHRGRTDRIFFATGTRCAISIFASVATGYFDESTKSVLCACNFGWQ
jgi:hypothetical protein